MVTTDGPAIVATRKRLGWSQRTLARVLVMGDDDAAIEAVRVLERRGTSERVRVAILDRLARLPVRHAAAIAAAATPDDPLACLAALLARGLPSSLQKVSDAQLTAALRRAGGCMADAARDLGIAHGTLRGRLSARPSLWPRGIQRQSARRGPERDVIGPRTATAIERTREAIRASGGNVAAAARALGTTRENLRLRALRYRDAWPDEIPWTMRRERPTT